MRHVTLTNSPLRGLTIGERIRWARKRKGISQKGLAEAIGTSRRHMIRLENNEHHPGRTFIDRIAEATDTTPSLLEDGEEEDEESALRRIASRLIVLGVDELATDLLGQVHRLEGRLR